MEKSKIIAIINDLKKEYRCHPMFYIWEHEVVFLVDQVKNSYNASSLSANLDFYFEHFYKPEGNPLFDHIISIIGYENKQPA